MNDRKRFSITENQFTYSVSIHDDTVHINAKSDIDKREWFVVITKDPVSNDTGLDSALVYSILEGYSLGLEGLSNHYIVEFPSSPKDKTGILLIVIRHISFFKSEEKQYQIRFKLNDELGDIERVEERISELRNKCHQSEVIMNTYRGIINDQHNIISELTHKINTLNDNNEIFENKFRILEQYYGFNKFNDNIAERPISPAPDNIEQNNSHVNSCNIKEVDTFISNSLHELINVCITRIDGIETDIIEIKNDYQHLSQILDDNIETINDTINELKSSVDDDNEVYRDNLIKINSAIVSHEDDLNNIKNNIENVQQTGIYSKRHIERINDRLTHISELINTKFTDTSKKIKEEFLSRSPSASGSWNTELLNR